MTGRNSTRFKQYGHLAALSLIFLLAISSCKTVPEKPYPDILGWLPPESDLLMRLEVQGNEELAILILESYGLGSGDLESVIDRAALVVVGMEAGSDMPVIHLATIGKWPRGVLGSALGRDWTKTGRYRWDGPDGLELTLPTGNELILSTGKADLMIDRAEKGSDAIVGSSAQGIPETPDMEIWITNPDSFSGSEGMLGLLAGNGINISDIGLILNRMDDGSYSILMNLTPADPAASRGLALVFRLGMSARFGLSDDPEERALLKKMKIEANAGTVLLEITSLDLAVIASLLGEFGLENEQ